MASAQAVPKEAPSSLQQHTPLDSLALLARSFGPDHVQRLLDILDRAAPSEATVVELANGNEEKQRIRASRLEFKMLNEIYDKKQYKHVVVESQSSSKEDDIWEEYIFVARKKFDEENKYYIEYIDIKSKELQDVLCEIFKDVSGVSLREDKPSIHPALLLNFLPQLEAYHSSHDTGIQHLELLIQYLTDHYAETIKRRNALLDHSEISFDLLWCLFQPNSLVYTTCSGSDQPRCLKFELGQMKVSPQGEVFFQLECRYLDYDGKLFGEVLTSLVIESFRGVKKINTLDVFPLQYHEQKEELKEVLLARGRKFVSLMGKHHRRYNGFAFVKKDGKPFRFKAGGQIMVDASEFKQNNPNYGTPKISSREDLLPDYIQDHWGIHASRHHKGVEIVKSNGTAPSEIREEDLLACNPTVLGFSFSNKLWGEFAVTDIEEIVWDSSSFEYLVLPKRQKYIIQSLAESQKMEVEMPFNDLVKGKGQGLLILLHGPAGVGKTLTAEVISEFLERPLYAVCAGDLGVDATKMEAKLSTILHLAHHWNAILLLDEADVFLEQRSHENVNRNALVSVFLRQLEYFQGTMFLTTNRVKTFDEAFQSRIHFALGYEKLGPLARREVWTTFLQRSGTSHIRPKDLDKLVEKDLNGRQIRNTLQTALTLAKNEGKCLSYKHLETIFTALEDFDRSFKGAGHKDNMNAYQ